MSNAVVIVGLTLALVTVTACGAAPEQPAPGKPTAQAFSPEDIRQGAYGDCWLEATMYAIAYTRPRVLQDAIRLQADGSAYVGLYQSGVRHWASVESVASDPNWQGNHTRAGDINWPAYVESAWDSLMQGDVRHAAWPGAAFDAFNVDAAVVTAWDRGLLRAAGPTVACTGSKVPTGLVDNHCYAVTGIKGDAVSLYNPWGASQVVTYSTFSSNFVILAVGI